MKQMSSIKFACERKQLETENECSRKGFEVFQEEEAQTVNVNKRLQHRGGRIRQARELEVPKKMGGKEKQISLEN